MHLARHQVLGIDIVGSDHHWLHFGCECGGDDSPWAAGPDWPQSCRAADSGSPAAQSAVCERRPAWLSPAAGASCRRRRATHPPGGRRGWPHRTRHPPCGHRTSRPGKMIIVVGGNTKSEIETFPRRAFVCLFGYSVYVCFQLDYFEIRLAFVRGPKSLSLFFIEPHSYGIAIIPNRMLTNLKSFLFKDGQRGWSVQLVDVHWRVHQMPSLPHSDESWFSYGTVIDFAGKWDNDS